MATKATQTAPASRSPRSKAQVQQEFAAIRHEAEAARKMAALQGGRLPGNVQDIAPKAIEGASGSRALAHVNQIAIEQAKGRPQG